MSWWILGGAVVASFAISIICVSLSIKLANRFDFLDYPDAERKTQERPIPKLGGLAVAAAFSMATLLALLVLESPGWVEPALSALVPALLAGLIGYLDDRNHLNPYLRLGLQALTGILVWWLGSQVAIFGADWLNALLNVVLVMVLINGLNLLDNSDGLAGSTVLISGLGASIIAVIFGQELVSVLGFALVGVSLGFLRYNWFPAQVYLGDSGAYFLATMLAVLIIRIRPETSDPRIGFLIALLLIILPLTDTTYVVVKRLRAGIHPFTAGRDHLSHRIQESGRRVPMSVLTLQALSLFGAVTAVGLSLLQVG